MSEQVVGTLEEIAIVKKGTGKKGPWTLRKITVDGEKYSTFDMIKATIGSTVEFEWTENDQGYKDVVRNSFVVTEEATPAKTAATTKAHTESATEKQTSIETQSSIASAALIVAAQISAGVNLADPAQAVASLVRYWTGNLLHPASPPKKAAAKPKPVAAEDVNQDDQPDY